MANYVTLRLPNSTITVESDNSFSIENLCVYCKENLGAFHETADYHELTLGNVTKEQLEKLYSVCTELGFF